MVNDETAAGCVSCKGGPVVQCTQHIAFQQWTDKGYVDCHASIPIWVCERCSAKSWDEAADAIIEEAVRREYAKLR